MKCPFVIKHCRFCNRLLVAYERNFAKKKDGKHGLNNKCKRCVIEYMKKYQQSEKGKQVSKKYNKQYYEDNKEYFKKYYKQYYEDNKEYFKEHQREYYENNKEVRKKYYENNKEAKKEYSKKYNKQYYEDNKQYIKEHQREYREKNPQVAFNIANKRRSREENQGRGITKEQWLDMMNYFQWRCAYSGEVLSNETRTIDHIIALNNGGLNEPWNCVPMVKSYNKSKRASDINEWYITQDFYSEERLNKIYEWQEYAYNKYYEEQ